VFVVQRSENGPWRSDVATLLMFSKHCFEMAN